ncbi:BTAD domain-containing putative transcriptional regulator [Catellatospora sp. KI3]|uniref:AfsR/SARP family transcriptional regulator n=1 Tax=Catellatospora sp. KI3 TaxID=3041620 RepID=UPI0024823299|nr:AfsR/SARP family transcriptional regulator [Catellatospora sp. KI3]MDI1464754.1 BTAD domain-containing putative transcriptional regulator [Catellatospora sp. KI3]
MAAVGPGPGPTVDVLGRLSVHHAGRRAEIGSGRQRALLSLLLLRPGRFASTDWLADALWDGDPPPSADTTLRTHVAGLRRILEPDRTAGAGPRVLRHRDGGYHLDLAADAVDLDRFEALLTRAGSAHADGAAAAAERDYTAALSLWRGDPLPDVADLSAVQADLARLHGLRLQAAEGRLTAAVEAGGHLRVLPELQAFVAAHPLREAARAQLMLALYRCGRQAEALALFAEAHRLLSGEYGLDPGERLRAVHRAILAQDPALDPPRRGPGSLPGAGAAEQALPGRAAVLGRLAEARAAAVAGTGRFALVVGEAGVGKTSVAERAAAAAERDGTPVVWARCPAVGQAPPFWVWVQLVRRLADGPRAGQAATGQLAALGAHAPEASGQADPVARFRLYEAVAELVAAAAAERGLLMVIDDLHAADPDSLLLLNFLAGALASTRALVVLTTRPYQHDAGLVAAVAELARAPGTVRLDLSGLDEAALAELIRSQTGGDPAPEAVAALRHRTGGNPFFAVELLRQGASAELPPTVRDALSLRLDALPAPTRDCLDVLAVGGQELDLRLLAQVLDTPVPALAEALVPAFAARLVVETEPGRVGFGHPLYAEVGYALLAPPRRAWLHARLALAQERLGGAAPSAIAFHYGRAVGLGHGDDHLRWLLRAADDATRRLAYEDALAHLDLAAAQLSERDGAAARELSVQLQRAALLQVTVGIGSDAVDRACARARELLAAVGPGTDLASARWVLGELAANRAEYAICVELAVPLAAEDDELARAAGAYLLGAAYYFLGRLGEAERRLTESARLLSGMDPRLLGREVARRPALAPYNFRALVRSLRGDRAGAQQDLTAAAVLADRLDDPYGRANAALYAAWLGLQELDAAAGSAAALRFRQLGQAHGMPHFVTTAELFAAWAAVSGGDPAARDRLRAAYEGIYRLGLRATRTVTLGAMAAAHLAAGDRTGAAELAAEGLALAAQTGERVFLAELLRLRALATGDRSGLDRAAAVAAGQGARLLADRIARTVADLR